MNFGWCHWYLTSNSCYGYWPKHDLVIALSVCQWVSSFGSNQVLVHRSMFRTGKQGTGTKSKANNCTITSFNPKFETTKCIPVHKVYLILRLWNHISQFMRSQFLINSLCSTWFWLCLIQVIACYVWEISGPVLNVSWVVTMMLILHCGQYISPWVKGIMSKIISKFVLYMSPLWQGNISFLGTLPVHVMSQTYRLLIYVLFVLSNILVKHTFNKDCWCKYILFIHLMVHIG